MATTSLLTPDLNFPTPALNFPILVSNDVTEKLRISGISLIPYMIVAALWAGVAYGVRGQAITGSVGGDVGLWIASVVTYFGTSFGMMFVPWP